MVQMEMHRIKRERIIGEDDKQDEMMQIVQQYITGNKYQTVVQWSLYSKPSASPVSNKDNADIDDDLLTQIGLSTNGNGDGGDDGGNGGSGNNTFTNEGLGRNSHD